MKGIKYITCSTLGWHDDLLQHFHLSENKLYMGCSFVFSCLPFFDFHINRIHKASIVFSFYEQLWDLFHRSISLNVVDIWWQKKEVSTKSHSLPHEFISVKVFLIFMAGTINQTFVPYQIIYGCKNMKMLKKFSFKANSCNLCIYITLCLNFVVIFFLRHRKPTLITYIQYWQISNKNLNGTLFYFTVNY